MESQGILSFWGRSQGILGNFGCKFLKCIREKVILDHYVALYIFCDTFPRSILHLQLTKANMPGKCQFKDIWLENLDFTDWVVKVDDRKAICKVCRTTVEISNTGDGALRTHMNGKKHIADWSITFNF